MNLAIFIAGGFLGQLASVLVVELVRPFVSHYVAHRRWVAAGRKLGCKVQCACGEWVGGPS